MNIRNELIEITVNETSGEILLTDKLRNTDWRIDFCVKENIQLDFISYNVYSDNPKNHADGALRLKDIADKYNSELEIYITELNVDLGGISLEERAYTPHRAAGLGAVIFEYYKRAGFIGTFQYHIYDQFCDPNDFKPFYARYRYMAEHWNDIPHRLGLFDGNSNPRPQYFLYSMLYSMAENEIAVKADENADLRILASYNGRYQGVHPCDKRYYDIFAYCEKNSLPVITHMAATFSSGVPIDYARPYHADSIACDFPKLKLVLAHLGHPWEAETIAVIRRHENVYADISALYYRPWQFYNSMRLAAEYNCCHKLLFGSDYPATSTEDSIKGVRNVNNIIKGSGLSVVPDDIIEAVINRDSIKILF
jgi:hypothetical protein